MGGRLETANRGRRSIPALLRMYRSRPLQGPYLRTLDIIGAMYRHFGRALNGRAETPMRASLTIRPRGGYGENYYRLKDYELDSALEGRSSVRSLRHSFQNRA